MKKIHTFRLCILLNANGELEGGRQFGQRIVVAGVHLRSLANAKMVSSVVGELHISRHAGIHFANELMEKRRADLLRIHNDVAAIAHLKPPQIGLFRRIHRQLDCERVPNLNINGIFLKLIM